jgi:ankyrin repeat protein
MNVIKMLLMGNVDINEVDSEGNTALHWCLSGISSKQEPRWLSQNSYFLVIKFEVTCARSFQTNL